MIKVTPSVNMWDISEVISKAWDICLEVQEAFDATGHYNPIIERILDGIEDFESRMDHSYDDLYGIPYHKASETETHCLSARTISKLDEIHDMLEEMEDRNDGNIPDAFKAIKHLLENYPKSW